MRISKLVSLGTLLFAVAFAAGADEAPAPDAGAEGAPAVEEPAASAETETPVSPEAAPAVEPAAEAAVPPSGAETATGSEPVVPSEATAASGAAVPPPEAGDAVPATAETTESESPEAPALGAVGYDSEGRPGRVHVVARGDTLWDISDAYLGTPWVWPSIWKDNQEIQNPHLIRPGDRIWITPSEMRRVSEEEAARLLAGQPAAPDGDAEGALPPSEPSSPLAAPQAPEKHRLHVSAQDGVGLVTPEALEAAGSILSAVPNRVMLGQRDQVYVGVPEGDTQKGDQFTVFRVREKVFDPESGRLLGHHVDILGWVEVERTHPESAYAVIRESYGEIQLGDRLMPRTPVPAEIAVQSSPGDIDGRISFFANSRTVMGTSDFVYLNRGSLDGLEVGSPLEVYRESFLAREETRNERVRVPERIVAQMLVVKAEPMTAVAYVMHTDEELALGDRFRGAQE
jgi:hypothetical protein